MATEQTAILFRRALGLNDSTAISTQIMKTNPRDVDGAGDTEFIDCLNVTITSDGCVEKIPAFTTVLDTGAPITRLSAGKRFFYSDGVDTKEWLGGATVANRFPIIDGPIAHTPQDVRVSTATKNYKSTDAAPAVLAEATVGVNSGPATSVAFAAMPLFKHAFVHHAKLFLVNRTDPRAIQYSEDYAYDLYNLGDNFMLSQFQVLQAGSIPGVVVTTHAEGVTVYRGASPLEIFDRKFYPCAPIDNTLYSGFISKVDGHAHVFLCDDGVYTVGEDGVPKNLTVEQTARLGAMNTSYIKAAVHDGKYWALGNQSMLEYCFRAKGLVKQAPQGVVDVCTWNGTPYFAIGSTIVTYAEQVQESLPCSVTLPYSDLSARGRKNFRGLYFTGTASGCWSITATDETGASWTIDRDDDFQNVTGQYIKTPKVFLSNHISIKIECLSGEFRLEELRAIITASRRSR